MTMPKHRPKAGSRNVEKKMFIICEGAKDKSEPAYLEAFKLTCSFNPKKVEVEICDTLCNTGKELVKIAKNKLRDVAGDIAWIVYDKDGYTKHPETFDAARANHIHIAFSSISFEYWLLLHLKYTARPFAKSEDVISYMKKECGFNYEKKRKDTFKEICKVGVGSLENAMKYAKRVQKHHSDGSHGVPIYELNPYTNMNELIDDIKRLENEG